MSTIYAHGDGCNCLDCTGNGPKIETQVRIVVAFLSVYIVHRCFGGREEGGWWYDAFEHTGASFPYQAQITMEWVSADDQPTENEGGEWKHDGAAPTPADEPTRVRVESVRSHYVSMYGEPNTEHRGSMAQRKDDYVFIHELEPGERETRERPRYE